MENQARISYLSSILGALGKLLIVSLFWWDALFVIMLDFRGTASFIDQHGLPLPKFLAGATAIALLILPAMVFFRRTEALGFIGLSLFCLLTALVFHQYWTLNGFDRVAEQIQFMKNLALAGALLMIFDHSVKRLPSRGREP